MWERVPSPTFDPTVSGDPRGLFIISTEDNKISACFKTPNGEILLTITGKTALGVAKKIAQLELTNLPEHLIDIGCELQKAEIAISQGIAYTQDKPLNYGVKR